jgi:thiosulfate/3-mercaptopyruvate sulfurtransferase
MTFTTLIDTERLAGRLSDPALVIVDCQFDLHNPPWGEREYLAAHVPGAVYADLNRDLAGVKTGANGRHPLPDPAALTDTFGRLGIGPGVQVVAYDQDTGMYASRLWWLLRWLRHPAVAVLDGGLAAWRSEGRPTRSGAEQRAPRKFAGHPDASLVAETTVVEQIAAGRATGQLLDARAAERYRGEIEPIDRIAGHIPTAANRFFKDNLDATGRFLSRDELRVQLAECLGSASPDTVVSYCGSGVTACHNLLALEHAGLQGGRLYPGSWSEWSSGERRPVATGDRR